MKAATRRGAFRLEHMHEPLAPVPVFRQRILRSLTITACVILGWLAIGMAGYHWWVRVPHWLDSLYSASMILGGMGPVGPDPSTAAGKWFASIYAILSGVLLLASVGFLMSPVLHRVLHRFHIAEEDESGE